MKHVKSSEAAKSFGRLMDDVQVEPVTISSHGRPVAVMYSYREAQKIESIKLEKLKELVAEGIKDADEGRVKPIDAELLENIKQRGRKRLNNESSE